MPLAMAIVNSLMRSVALPHIIWMPSSSSVSASATTLMFHALQIDDALAVAAHKVFAVFTAIPFALASSAVMPTDAISGSV